MKASINRKKEFLKVQPEKIHPINGKVGAPQIYFFKNCEHTIEEVNKYHWKKMRTMSARNPLEQTTDVDDHTVDALRYMIMAKWPAAASAKDDYKKKDFMMDEEKSNPIMTKFSKPGDAVLGDFYG